MHRSTQKIFAASLASLMLAGCGNMYRPVVSATNPVGPAAQPQKYAVAISNPGGGQPGLVTFVNISGDTVITSPSIQTNPNYIALSGGGTSGYTINAAGALDLIPSPNNPGQLLTSSIVQTTLAPSAAPVSLSAFTLGGSSGSLFIPESGSSNIAVLNNTTQLLQEVSVGANPVYTVGADGTSRAYVISKGDGATAGSASAIETSTTAGFSVSKTITVGTDPVYGVMNSTAQRAFILNKGSESVNVINVINNALDTNTFPTTPPAVPAPAGTIALPPMIVGGGDVSLNPVWADLSPATNELVVLSAGLQDNVHRGSVSIIDTTLCNPAAQPSNPNCSVANPVDANSFGTVYATVPVGINPTMVAVLQDANDPRAYVVNGLDGTGLCPAGEGSVSVVSLKSNTVTATICGSADATDASTPTVFGHPSTLAVTTGNPTGKVYVTSPDSKQLTIIYTDSDTVSTHVPLFGTGVKVLVTQP